MSKQPKYERMDAGTCAEVVVANPPSCRRVWLECVVLVSVLGAATTTPATTATTTNYHY